MSASILANPRNVVLASRFSEPPILQPQLALFLEDATKGFPEEVCGYAAGGRYVPWANVATDKRANFQMVGHSWRATLERFGSIEAVLHSHPFAGEAADFQPGIWPDCPSASDMHRQIDTAVPWAVTVTNGKLASPPFWFGDQLPVPVGPDPARPLVGRPFRHGVTDCYSLIRDWYRLERGVTLREFARDWDWWEDGQDLYLDGFAAAGFRRIDEARAETGDVFLVAMPRKPSEKDPRTAVVNHAGIYLGAGLGLHHPAPGLVFGGGAAPQLSRTTPLARYKAYMAGWLRFDSGSMKEIPR